MILFQISPDTFDHPGHYDTEIILSEVKKASRQAGDYGRRRFAELHDHAIGGHGGCRPGGAEKIQGPRGRIAAQGVAGFGEMTAEHFAGYTPYQYAPADHPLYLMLADIAAAHNIPIDLHMEAVPQDMALPSGLKSPPNAPRLHANIAAFEKLLVAQSARKNYLGAFGFGLHRLSHRGA